MATYKEIVGWSCCPTCDQQQIKIRVGTSGDPANDFTYHTLANGDVIEDTNLSQVVPTHLFDSFTGLTFKQCNLHNAIIDTDKNTIDGGLVMTRAYCSHVHPKMVADGLPECVNNCAHVKEIVEAVVIDGVEVSPAENIYSDKITSLKGVACEIWG